MYVVVRYDSERELDKIGESNSLEGAKKIMQQDFKKFFLENYQDEMEDDGCDYETMYEDVEGNECELDEWYAWINNCKCNEYMGAYDFDWKIIEVGKDENVQKNAVDSMLKNTILQLKDKYPKVKDMYEIIQSKTKWGKDLTYDELTAYIRLMKKGLV